MKLWLSPHLIRCLPALSFTASSKLPVHNCILSFQVVLQFPVLITDHTNEMICISPCLFTMVILLYISLQCMKDTGLEYTERFETFELFKDSVAPVFLAS